MSSSSSSVNELHVTVRMPAPRRAVHSARRHRHAVRVLLPAACWVDARRGSSAARGARLGAEKRRARTDGVAKLPVQRQHELLLVLGMQQRVPIPDVAVAAGRLVRARLALRKVGVEQLVRELGGLVDEHLDVLHRVHRLRAGRTSRAPDQSRTWTCVRVRWYARARVRLPSTWHALLAGGRTRTRSVFQTCSRQGPACLASVSSASSGTAGGPLTTHP